MGWDGDPMGLELRRMHNSLKINISHCRGIARGVPPCRSGEVLLHS